jgi:hypothetical protein
MNKLMNSAWAKSGLRPGTVGPTNDQIGPTLAAWHAHAWRGHRALARHGSAVTGGAVAAGLLFGLSCEYHHGKVVVSGKVEEKRAHPGGATMERSWKMAAHGGLSTAMALR